MKKMIKERNNKKKDTNIVVSQFNEYFSYYKENYKKKHILLYVISIIIFFVFLSLLISSIDVTSSIQQIANGQIDTNTDILKTILKEDIPISFLIIFAGITPFLHLSIIGLLYPYVLAGNIASMFAVSSHTSSLIFTTVGCIIKIFGMALSIAAGFDYCSYSTKKFRYSQSGSLSFQDLKKRYYMIRKNDEKLKEIDLQIQKKAEKKEKFNVKVPYKMFFYTFIISTIIIIIGTVFTAI